MCETEEEKLGEKEDESDLAVPGSSSRSSPVASSMPSSQAEAPLASQLIAFASPLPGCPSLLTRRLHPKPHTVEHATAFCPCGGCVQIHSAGVFTSSLLPFLYYYLSIVQITYDKTPSS